MRKNALDILFGSALRVRLMRFFFLNEFTIFTLDDLVKKTRLRKNQLLKELTVLQKSGLVLKAKITLPVPPTARGKRKDTKKILQGFQKNADFAYGSIMEQLFTSSIPEAKEQLGNDAKRMGKLKFVVLSGIFLSRPNEEVDLLVVGDQVNRGRLEATLKRLEREIGRDIVYALMPTDEFEYRYNMHDRFLQGILERPHEILIDEFHVREEEKKLTGEYEDSKVEANLQIQ